MSDRVMVLTAAICSCLLVLAVFPLAIVVWGPGVALGAAYAWRQPEFR